ncbi:negative regulator of systemic acquired resistance SNI1 isoform X2 [Morus notabilis]|uniref:negative regulator of systemic acquired resistance SNI1 isoform X2 n=1 Tax=Morus notabilis TaxID=981085 RepID=UPI000CED08C9|nr:negative regulator of systemic acquired resistance SNI1 isoform X2 [Morus notabilis]
MEISGNGKGKGRGVEEENILAIIAASGTKDTQDAHEDRIAFLEAVRSVSILSDDRVPPSYKLCQEVFKILRIGKSLELIMASYQLLDELEKAFPRVHLSNVNKPQSENAIPELVVAKEAWSPFVVSMEHSGCQREADKDKGGQIDSYGFHLLIQDLINVADETNFQQSDTKGSRKINYRSLVKDCLAIMCKLYENCATFSDDLMHLENSVGVSDNDSNTSVAIALLEVAKNTCIAMQKFFTVIMELDTSKKKAEMNGCTRRADGVRTPIVELILDELTYNRDILHSFLQAYAEPEWKLEVVVQYLWKYISKPSVRTRRTNVSADDTTFGGALKFFSNITIARSTTKNIGAKEIQLLLVHGFQAYLSLPSKHSDEVVSSPSEETKSCSLIEICKDIISSFKTLRETDKNMEISAFGKEVLFTAATIISVKS